MKILIIVTKAEIGGAQIFVLNLARKLKELGNEITVAFGEGSFLPDQLQKSDIKGIRLKTLKRTKNPFKNIFFALELRSMIKENNFDALHLNSSNTLIGAFGLLFLKNRPKTIFTVHGLSVIDPNHQANFILKKIYLYYFKFAFRFIDHVVFISSNNFNTAKKLRLTQESKIIYSGIENPDFIDKALALGQLSKILNFDLSGKFIIGSIGRLAYPKNYEFLISSFNEILVHLPSAIGIIIGEGPQRQKYENLIRENNLQNNFFLAGEIESAGKFLRCFDLFVLPSIFEGLSITLIEALFAKIKVLASDVGGNKEIISQENVFELDKENFISKIIQLKNGQLAEPSTDKDKFLLDNMAAEYLKLYSK